MRQPSQKHSAPHNAGLATFTHKQLKTMQNATHNGTHSANAPNIMLDIMTSNGT